MKVIFLDVDGVLNSVPDCQKTKWKMQVGGHGCIGIYKPRVRNLSEIVKATGAKIVLVSSWKSSYDYYIEHWQDEHVESLEYYQGAYVYGKYLREKLREFDLEIYDTTSKVEPEMWLRGAGIRNWIAEHDVESFVVLDDEEFRDYKEQNILPYWVKPSWYDGGLDENHVKQAIAILNGEEHE